MNFQRLHRMLSARAAVMTKHPTRFKQAEHDFMNSDESKAILANDSVLYHKIKRSQRARTKAATK